MYNLHRFRVPFDNLLSQGAERMSTGEYDGKISGKALAFFLVFGSVGAIIMSWIAYTGVVGAL